MLRRSGSVGGVGDEHRLARVERALQLGIAIEVDDEVPDRRILVARDEPNLVLFAGEEDRAAIEAERVAQLAGDRLENVDEVKRGRDFLQDVDDGDEVVALALKLGYASMQTDELVISPIGPRHRRRERPGSLGVRSVRRILRVGLVCPSSGAVCALNSSLSNRTTRLRPVSFATYSASSAARTSPSQCADARVRPCRNAEARRAANRRPPRRT